jgi:hypothetical protein|tara:strand:- start:137 stop:367 length:231 start_codon:yes stop_codon:yes gene_type:complete
MCIFSTPKPPPLPKPEPRDSAIEDTADKVVIADKRTQPDRKKKAIKSTRVARRLGTRSLQIPLNPGVQSGNLNYPT